MAIKGGTNPNAGRPKGAKNASTIAKQEAMAKAAAALVEALGDEEVFSGDAHALLCAIYKNKHIPLDIRMEAAKQCLPYEKPRLNQNQLTNSKGEELQISI